MGAPGQAQRMRTRALACALSIVAPLSGAELLDISVRLGYERPTDSHDVISDTGAGEESRHAHWDSIDRFVIEALFGRTWLIYGVGAVYQETADETDGIGSELTRVGGRVMVGASLPMGKWFHLELLPFVGYGLATYDLDRPLIDNDADGNAYLEWGANLDLVFRVEALMEMGLGVGWLASEVEFDNTLAGAALSTRIEEGGVLGRVFVGVHF